MQALPLSKYIFPDPIEADPEGHGFICAQTSFYLFEAYTHGLFPWFNEDEPICWWSPEPRCIIEPHAYKPSKSLIRNMKKHDYRITVNHAFEDVIRSCSLPVAMQMKHGLVKI
jgi:leucyl/phenylalanyl-tRNA--protein transferase